MSGKEYLVERPVLCGVQSEAKYIDQMVPSYRGNPLIEALPPIFEPHDVIEKFAQYPDFEEGQRIWPNQVRMHCIYQLKDLIQPMPLHLDVETRFSIMIRQGYTARNPLSAKFKKQFSVGFKEILESGCDIQGYNLIGNLSSANGFCIIGPSGIGKTKSVEKTLLMYPQVIVHHNHPGLGLTTQITWLKLDCPSDGGLKSLCIDFFKAIDLILGTNYSKTHVKDRSTAETLLPVMAQIASLHCLGVLVIDEIQNLNLAKSGGEERALNFFTKLVNVIGIPVVLVGTFKALYLFESSFAQARRASGMGDMVLDRILKNREWDLLLHSIWDYQWTKNFVPLTDELKTALYDESQGIIDIAVKLFMHAQWKAIATKQEKISIPMIKKAAEENLQLVQPFIKALRMGDIDKLKKYDDLRPDWLSLNHYVLTSNEPIKLYGKASIEHQRAQKKRESDDGFLSLMRLGTEIGIEPTKAQELAVTIIQGNEKSDMATKRKLFTIEAARLFGQLNNFNVSSKKNKMRPINTANKNKKVKTEAVLTESDVLAIANKGFSRNIAAVESLSDAGLIASFTEFI